MNRIWHALVFPQDFSTFHRCVAATCRVPLPKKRHHQAIDPLGDWKRLEQGFRFIGPRLRGSDRAEKGSRWSVNFVEGTHFYWDTPKKSFNGWKTSLFPFFGKAIFGGELLNFQGVFGGYFFKRENYGNCNFDFLGSIGVYQPMSLSDCFGFMAEVGQWNLIYGNTTWIVFFVGMKLQEN